MPDEKVNQVNRRFRLMINNLQVLLIVLINYSSIDHSQGDINIVIKKTTKLDVNTMIFQDNMKTIMSK